MGAPASIQHLRFPVLLWRRGYSYVANDAVELCAHPRSLFDETQARAAAGEFKLADSRGALHAVTEFERVARFGGWKSLPHALLRSVFAVPVLRPVTSQEFPAFRHVISEALKPRFGKAFAASVQNALSPEEVLALVAERDGVSG